MKETYAYKYGELAMLAQSLATTIKEDVRLDVNGPYGFAHILALSQANAIQTLLKEQEARGKE
jgi:hypothetical protein